MWPDSEQTQELLQQAGDGNLSAINALMDRHRDSLHNMVRMRLDRAIGRRVDASDVVQDVLLEASRRMSDYLKDPRLPYHLWLRQLAKDRIIDLYRRHRVAQRRSVDREQQLQRPAKGDQSSLDMVAAIADQELTPAAAVLKKELQQRFLIALEELSEDDKEIILMRHHEQLTNTEVAQVLELTTAAAGMRYLRALRRLREVLESGSEPDPEQTI